jgi:UDP-galactopyranose mutase
MGEISMYDYLIVGAGLAGCVVAERLASLGKQVLIVEKRNHIGGNCYDEYNEDGILIHVYGPHIFRTNNSEIWHYLSRFTDWHFYQHRVLTYIDGLKVPIPINLDTINTLFNLSYSSNDMKNYLEKSQLEANIKEIKNSRDMAVSQVGQTLYEKFFEQYTLKQWNLGAEDLAAEVIGRIPVRFNRDPRYFSDRYQGVPKYGYTKMFNKMLAHHNIQILLHANYKTVIDQIQYNKMIYTGPIDYYFDYLYGPLPYRSLHFEFETIPVETFQEVGTINYPNDHDFTRITEFKHLTGQRHSWTTLAREYPKSCGDPYYPVPTTDNKILYEQYAREAREIKNVFFMGRLAEYQYYSMDQVIAKALSSLNTVL